MTATELRAALSAADLSAHGDTTHPVTGEVLPARGLEAYRLGMEDVRGESVDVETARGTWVDFETPGRKPGGGEEGE